MRPPFTGWDLLRRHRDLRFLFLSNTLWSSGAMLYSFVWPNYVRDLGGTEREIGLLSSLMFATVAVTLLPGGWLADRVERRALMVVTWGLAAFAPLLYALARSWHSLIPGAILYNIFLGWPAMEAYIADSVPPEALARAFTLTGAGFSMGAILSPLLGGWLLPIIGMRGLFFMAFALFLLSTAVLALLAPSHPRPRPAGPAFPRGQRREIAWWTALSIVAALGSAALRPFLAPYLEDAVGWARPWILASSSLIAAGEIILAPVLGRISDRDGRRGLGRGLLLTASGACLLLGGPWAVVPALLLLGGDRVTGSLFRSAIGRWGGARRGVVFGGTLVLVNAAQAVGALAGARLYALRPDGPLLLGAGLYALAGIAVGLWRGRGPLPGYPPMTGP
ncbi:MAG: MFS transporter [Candidatus Bipolaricaulis sp.]